MGFNRWVIVPLSALVVFAVGFGISALVGLLWHDMPVIVRWGIPVVLMLYYLYDAMRREAPTK